jgi:hypothetical protein
MDYEQHGFPDAAPETFRGPNNWLPCPPDTDLRGWNSKVRRFFEYWLSIAPTGRLPGRQHFDPLHIPLIMPNVWMLDVVRLDGGLRFRYRLVGTREVATLQREVTGRWFDEVHPTPGENPIYRRFSYMIESRQGTYRKGAVGLNHREDHSLVENCMVPFASEGTHVDMIGACSVLFYENGSEVM